MVLNLMVGRSRDQGLQRVYCMQGSSFVYTLPLWVRCPFLMSDCLVSVTRLLCRTRISHYKDRFHFCSLSAVHIYDLYHMHVTENKRGGEGRGLPLYGYMYVLLSKCSFSVWSKNIHKSCHLVSESVCNFTQTTKLQGMIFQFKITLRVLM